MVTQEGLRMIHLDIKGSLEYHGLNPCSSGSIKFLLQKVRVIAYGGLVQCHDFNMTIRKPRLVGSTVEDVLHCEMGA